MTDGPAMSEIPSNAKITPRLSGDRGYAEHGGWLKTYHTFSFSSYYDPAHMSFGCLRVLNEDRVAPNSGFPTHPHSDAEIFSYILTGELTHRDSIIKEGASQSVDFYRMKRGDVQFTTGGTGISHSELNERSDVPVHFLQVWVSPWKRGLQPRYHTKNFDEEEKRKRFVIIVSPLKAGKDASAEQEERALPAVENSIPIHADFVMGAAIIPSGKKFEWNVGAGEGVTKKNENRRVYVHLTMCKDGKSKIKVNDSQVLNEGDGAYIEKVNAGDKLSFESVGESDAEVVVFDSD